MEEDYFWTWTICYIKDDTEHPYYVRLEKMESGSCEEIFKLDYGRFKTFEEAHVYLDTLPEPEKAAEEEAKSFL